MEIFRTYEEGIDAIAKGSVDFVRFGPASYITAQNRNQNIELLAMEVDEDRGKWFDGVIVVRKDSKIQTLSDLHGCKFAFGDKNSTIGRYLVQDILAKAGIYAHHLKKYAYLGSHDAVAEAVIEGKFDAGAVKESTYERYKKDLRKIAIFSNVTKPWIARAGLSRTVCASLQRVLLNIQDPNSLKPIKVGGFAEPDDEAYDYVRDRMEWSKAFFPWWYVFMHQWPVTLAGLIVIGTVVYGLVTFAKRRRAVAT